MRIVGIIPARYGSKRFPGKPLTDIKGKKMIAHVYERVMQAKVLSQVVIATDHEEIAGYMKRRGAPVLMTSQNHISGTDRCREAMSLMSDKFDYVINIQGDEPFIFPEQVALLASILDGKTEIGTLIKKVDTISSVHNSNTVKVVINKNEEAIYFSRSPIPYLSDQINKAWLSDHCYYKHVGIYAYRSDVLNTIARLPMSSLEKAESLEQLRWLENGYVIQTKVTDLESFDINTPEDLKQALSQSEKR